MSDKKDTETKNYNFNCIEKKWQKSWEDKKIFEVKENKKKKKCYVLEMYPYPSASFLHMGHVRNFTIGDVFARFKRMSGFDVLYPMGYDSFGLPAETASKKAGIHPKQYTEEAIKKIREYQKASGNSYDWTKTLASHEPEYYKWNQYFFLKLFEKGLAYRKKAPVNWCPKCESVLANEEAEGGKCWRCEGEVIQKNLEQWFFKITEYADRLLEDLKKIDWPEKIKVMQENWIGRSGGTEINFEIVNPEKDFRDSEFVFFHAYKDNSNSVFWPWLKKEIESAGGKVVFTPDFPKPDEPNIEEWAEFALKKYNFNEKTVIVTHSLGGVLALKLLPKLKTKIRKLILIATPSMMKLLDGKKRPALEKCCDWNFDFEAVKEKAKEIVVLADEKDHLVRIEQGKITADKLSAKFVINVGEVPHFNSSAEPAVLNACLNKWPVFTTRPDTIYGVTFMVISAQHKKLMGLVTKENQKKVEEFVRKCQKAKTQEEIESLEKEGVFTGSYAVNPLTNEKIPIWVGNFVLADYGSGMVMAVPAHDQRDFEFAKKYEIPIKVVIQPEEYEINEKKMSRAFTDEGILVNSKEFNGIKSKQAIEDITKYLENKKLGKKTINYKIRDWMISRQRYWGTPIPIIYCDKCGIVSVPEKDLPVLLPEKVDFKFSGNPLASNKEFLNVKCPKCKGKAVRETDTMGGFVDSSWYFLRYCDNKNKSKPFDIKKVNYWMPVDQYIGGAEHAVMHLIYSRFFIKALKDLGFVSFDEPFSKLFNQGIVYKDGHKMSKSFGNVVFQTDISDKYGIDTARLFLMFVSSPDKQMEWSDEGVEGAFRIINKIIRLKENITNKLNEREESKINSLIKIFTENIENFNYPKSVVAFIKVLDSLSEVSKENYEIMLKLISPFCPHIAEELWHNLGNKTFISLEKWPKADESKINENMEKEEKIIEQTIEDIRNIINIMREKQNKSVSKIFLYTLPKEIELFKQSTEIFEKSLNLKPQVFAVNDKNKYDPQNKAGKAKPGKPAIYLE
jgi:leucyl-tRNA synthetase